MPSVDLTLQPTVGTPYGRWQPLNEPLRVAAFGINAIVCEPGEEFDVEHDHVEDDQEEAYVVVAGRAEFRIGEETIEAGPGVVVSAPVATVVRSYRAIEPGTRIVCVGAAPTPDDAAAGYGDWIADAAG